MNKTLGERLRIKRKELGLSVNKVSEDLKIRPEFIESIENDDFKSFKSEVYIKGFIRSYSKYLGLDENTFLSIYRRDIEVLHSKTENSKLSDNNSGKSTRINITREKIKYFYLFFTLVILFCITLSIVNKAFEPPKIKLTYPITAFENTENAIDYLDKTIRFNGEISPNTVLKINGISYPQKPDNTFESELFPITEQENVFIFEAISNVGVKSTIKLVLLKKYETELNSEGITGAIQVIKENSFIKVEVDEKEYINGLFFENDSIPIIGTSSIKIEADRPDNIKIIINGEEYKILNEFIKLESSNGRLLEVN